MKVFKGRVVTPGCAKAEAVVTHGGFNTLASFQSPLQFGDKEAKCGDQNNSDLYGKPMAGKTRYASKKACGVHSGVVFGGIYLNRHLYE